MITSLFCDLVAFTTQSEQADPEDLDRMLEAYFAIARTAIERHGGIVEKFIGDAVHGLFGVPVAHEDDPARAVRAGLEICSAANALVAASGAPLRLRVGVNTGEAFVHLDAKPGTGEAILVGDAVNTAARIQSAAPEQCVAVGPRTWEVTRLAFEYEELPPANLKGKAEPVRLFCVRGERSLRGTDTSRTHAGPYVGRLGELGRLRSAFEGASTTRRPRFALVAGEPGIGKSRIVAELARAIRATDPTVIWRQGRSLPYGDGTGFWALGEIVKTHAGIHDGDDAATARERLDATLTGLPEADWLCDRLLPLLGLPGGSASREELFAAWTAYLRSMARTGPAVVVFEDVHWADPALLTFIEHLADPVDAPLLVVATTRPEVFERAPGFAASPEGVVRVDLTPLDESETAELVVGLLGSIVPAELQAPIRRLSEGNPLYAEELVRLLGDRDLLIHEAGSYRLRRGADIPLPESIQGLLASRLDTLADRERTVIAGASIVGQAFWPEAVAAITGQDAAAVQDALAMLVVRELVRHSATSSVRTEREYAFWHVLARDVAYMAQPRGQRIDGHLAAATWIGDHGGRREDVAGVVAHHLATALELAEAARDPREPSIRPRARASLTEAASNAMGLDVEAATGLYARALELAPPGSPERLGLLRAYGVAAAQSARPAEALEALEEALALAEVAGDPEEIGRTMVAMLLPLQAVQDHRWVTLPAEAERILRPLGPSALLVDVLVAQSRASLWDWSWDDTRRFAEQAIEMAAELGLPPPPRALGIRGTARMVAGDRGGLDDMELGVQGAAAVGDWDQAAGILLNYAVQAGLVDGLERTLELTRRAIAICDAHGLRSQGYLHRTNLAGSLIDAGRLDEASRVIDDIIEPVLSTGEVLSIAFALMSRFQIDVIRGELDGAAELLPRLVAVVDATPDQDDFNPPRIVAAEVLHGLGRSSEAARLLRAVLATPAIGPNHDFWAGPATRLAIAIGDLTLAEAILAALVDTNPLADLGRRSASAMLAEARASHDDAAAGYLATAAGFAGHQLPFETACAYLGAARCLIALGREAEAREPLATARTLFEGLGAAPSLAEVADLEARVLAREAAAS